MKKLITISTFLLLLLGCSSEVPSEKEIKKEVISLSREAGKIFGEISSKFMDGFEEATK